MLDELGRLGFTRIEAKIYLELLKSGHLMAGNISKKTMINRRTTYDTLNRLLEKGYVGFNVSSNRKVFYAMKPETILDNIDNMKLMATDVISKLKNIHKKEENKIATYVGRKGIRNILNMILEESKEYLSIGTRGHFHEVMQHDFYIFQDMKKKKKIKGRTILSKEIKEDPAVKYVKTSEIKFLPKKLAGPMSTFIFNDKVAIIIWDEPLFGILLEGKNINRSFKEYFEELWKLAKK